VPGRTTTDPGNGVPLLKSLLSFSKNSENKEIGKVRNMIFNFTKYNCEDNLHGILLYIQLADSKQSTPHKCTFTLFSCMMNDEFEINTFSSSSPINHLVSDWRGLDFEVRFEVSCSSFLLISRRWLVHNSIQFNRGIPAFSFSPSTLHG